MSEETFASSHGHRILVHTVHAALENHAADDVAVVELLRAHGPSLLAGIAKDGVSYCIDVSDEWRDVPLHRRLRFQGQFFLAGS